jgi:hypothetical protein
VHDVTIKPQTFFKKNTQRHPCARENNVQQLQRSKKTFCKEAGESKIIEDPLSYISSLEGTTEYHRTKEILYVMKLLGHKNIANTLIYTQLVEFEGDEYSSALAHNVDEAQKLIEAGFEYVYNHNETMLFRKRK